jgi:hypothetical protein
MCAFHAAQRAQVADEAALHDVLVQGERVREAARWAVKLELALPKEHPGIAFTVGQDGNFIIRPNQPVPMKEQLPDGTTRTVIWPGVTLSPPGLARVNTAVRAAVAGVRQPTGTRTVTVG